MVWVVEHLKLCLAQNMLFKLNYSKLKGIVLCSTFSMEGINLHYNSSF